MEGKVVSHWVPISKIDDEEARTALARWMAGDQMVEDLDQKATNVRSTFSYFPLWFFRHRREDDVEETVLEPAAATPVSEIKGIDLPTDELRRYDAQALGDQVQPQTVPLETALVGLWDRDVPFDQIAESGLVHVPVYTFTYDYSGETYTAVVEAATGQVLADRFPTRAKMPSWLVVGLTGILFLCLAAFPLLGVFISGTEGLIIGVLLLVGVGLPVGLALFALVRWMITRRRASRSD